MAAVVYTTLLAALRTAIDGMTTGGGYHFAYDNVDRYKHSTKTYPNVLVHLPGEENRDPDGEVVNAYTADSEVTFEVTVASSTSSVDTDLDKVVEDFKRLLEAQHATLQAAGLIVADYIREDREYTHVRARPGKVKIIFNLTYRVQKSNPSLT
jgi:hypothetical protein